MRYADVTLALKAHVRDGVFYRTDHHWTSLGAYCAFDASAELLGIETPITNYRVHVPTNSFEGTLASKSGKHTAEDTITAYEPLAPDELLRQHEESRPVSSLSLLRWIRSDKYRLFSAETIRSSPSKTTANNGKTLLIFMIPMRTKPYRSPSPTISRDRHDRSALLRRRCRAAL